MATQNRIKSLKRLIRQHAIGIVFIVIIVAMSIALTVDLSAANERIAIFSTIVGMTATLSTLFLGILIYQRFGIEASLIEKQLQCVFLLVEEIGRTRFIVSKPGLALQVTMRNPYVQSLENYYGLKLLFTKELFRDFQPISNLADNPFMPKNIATKIQSMRFVSINGVPLNNHNNYAQIRMSGGSTESTSPGGLLNDRELTLKEYVQYLIDIQEEVQEWLEENSDYGANLNF